MTEEEKAVEKFQLWINEGMYVGIGTQDGKVLLNLIEKQQKEIEKKDKIIAEYNRRGQTLNNLTNVKDTFMYKEICKNFIPKDKIRELIEKVNREFLEGKNDTFAGDIFDAIVQKSKVEVLQELLEEE